MLSWGYSKLSGQCVLYHSSFSELPANLGENFIHNVKPIVLAEQLRWMKKSYSFVHLEEYFAATNRKGLAAISFDDGYQSVMREALPVLKSLNVPATIFLVSSSFRGKLFWRDKIRQIIAADKQSEFVEMLNEAFVTDRFNSDSLYKLSKSPHINNKKVDHLADQFLESCGISMDADYLVKRIEDLVDDPLFRYGNHTANHYVLSSLSTTEQENEIYDCKTFLNKLPSVSRSRIFSIPFGDIGDFNDATIELVIKAGYSGALLSRNRLTHGPGQCYKGLPFLERYMAPSTLRGMKKKIFQMLLARHN